MKLILKNIGKIKDAKIDINGITVIAGENNTGKSTISRALFSMFNGFHDVKKEIEHNRRENIVRLTWFFEDNMDSGEESRYIFSEWVHRLLENKEVYSADSEKLKHDIIMHFNHSAKVEKDPNPELNEYIERIQAALRVSDDEMIRSLVERKLKAEFFGQINNIFTSDDSEIQLQVRNEILKAVIKNNGVTALENLHETSFRTEAIYIDDPFVLDASFSFSLRRRGRYTGGHQEQLIKKLWLSTAHERDIVSEILVDNKLKQIYSKINAICSGNIDCENSRIYGYKKRNTDKILAVQNLSTGLKTFVILKSLLTSGMIEENGTVILDEPEIHLHPEWQVLFAELIVLLQKNFQLHILLNTHSPYFLNAIEVYSEKYDVADKCKYYLATRDGDNGVITDVTENTEEIYRKLALPFQKLENERYSDD